MASYTLQEPASATSDDRDIPEDTVLVATLVNISKREKTNKDNEKYTRLNWRFRINDPESAWDGQSIYGETSTSFVRHADCKFYAWAQMVMGFEFPSGFDIETDDLVEKECRIVTGRREYTSEGEPRVYVYVEDVMPFGKMVEPVF